MASTDQVSKEEELLQWELDEGVPQIEDEFLRQYFAGREALIQQEKRQRHDVRFKQTMSPMAHEAAKIMAAIRHRELREVWTSEYEQSLAEKNGGNLYPGMMYTLAKSRMEKTDLFKIIERMPKGALVHAHMDAMLDMEWLADQALAEPGFCIVASEALDSQKKRASGFFQFRYYPDSELPKEEKGSNIWLSDYIPNTPVPVRKAADTFPDPNSSLKDWLVSRSTISVEDSLCHHHGLGDIWRKFQLTFIFIGWIYFYEPIFRRAMQRLFKELAADGITYADLRIAFEFEFRKTGQTNGEKGRFHDFFEAFGQELKKFQETEEGKSFKGARFIWTVIRSKDNRSIAASMRECIRLKQMFPDLICGFDCVGQEDTGRTLADLTPILFWFKKKCYEANVNLPFFFHAGECLGDGDSTDNNLFDAILLGTRRIGHAYSLYKHPLLIDMVKEKKILVECCPISNEILRLTSSILAHSLPALLSRGVAVSINNDDPSILGHGRNGLTPDFWQTFMAFDNLGLEGLAAMAENSVRWCAIEDQNNAEWQKGLLEGYMGRTTKAKLMKEWRSEFEKWCQWVIMEYPLEVEDEGDEEDLYNGEDVEEGEEVEADEEVI